MRRTRRGPRAKRACLESRRFRALHITNGTVSHLLYRNGMTVQAAVIELSPADLVFVVGIDAKDLTAADFIL